MTEQWEKDMEKSAVVIKQALPILRTMLSDTSLDVMQVEGKTE